jgi:hypothetical protein
MVTTLHGSMPPACELGEVASTPPMQESAASESSPRNAHIVQGFSPAPLLQSLLANLEEDDTTALTLLGAHDMHAPLVLDAGGIRARPAQVVAVEVGQVVVVALDELVEQRREKLFGDASVYI